MKVLFIVLLIFSNLFSQEYYTLDEFSKLHQDEPQKMFSFDSIVQDAPQMLTVQQNRPVNITIVYPGEEASDYWRRSEVAFKKRMELLNIKYTIKNNFIKADDIALQTQAIRDALTQDTDYIVFTLDISAHKKIISQLLSRKKPKLILQNITTPLVDWEGNQPFLYVGFDHREGTKLLKQYFQEKFPDGANYAMLYFRRGFVSKMRGDSFISMIGDKFQLKNAYYTDGNVEKSFAATKRIMDENKNIDFLYSCSTDVSIGAIKALENITNPPLINGWGGGSIEIELIKEKKLEVTVMRMNDDNGVAMAEAIKLDLEGKRDNIPQVYSGKFVLIDKDTASEKIFTYQKQAFRYSGLK